MLNTLRGRLVLSHVLPLLVIIPLMGIALIYILESQVLLPLLVNELQGNATLIAEITGDTPDLWQNSAQAQAVLAHIDPGLKARVMLLDSYGRLLASSDPSDAGLAGQPVEHPAMARVLAGMSSTHVDYSQRLHSQIADVFIPVLGSNGQILGVVRLSYPLENVYADILRFRYLIAGVLAAGLFMGGAIGWLLAADLERPLQRVTHDVYRLASGRQLTPLPEHGISEIRLLLQAFNTLMERLREMEEARRVLLAALVHELGRPLGAVYSAVQALQTGAGRDESLREELLGGMADEIQRLQRLVGDLTLLRDHVVGGLQLDARPVSLSHWLPDVLVPWREAARQKGLQWEAAIPADLPEVEIDPDRAGQALGNLLSNAIKYTPPGGTVSVNSGVMEDEVWVRISDTGPGISPEEQARIFTPFYRGHPSNNSEKGTGLGLSIARELIVAQGGRVEVASTLGEGSHFTLWLPLGFSFTHSTREGEDQAAHSAPARIQLAGRKAGQTRIDPANMSLLNSSSATSVLFNPGTSSNHRRDW